jgi:hypothetical protein
MADGSEMLTYLLYAVLVIVLAVAGWYIGNRWKYKEVGTVVGGLIGVGIVYWHSTSTSGNSYSF